MTYIFSAVYFLSVFNHVNFWLHKSILLSKYGFHQNKYQHTSKYLLFIFPEFRFFLYWFHSFFLISYYFYFYLLFIMGKDIWQIYKYSQYQLSTLSIKAPLLSYVASQTPSLSFELTITHVLPGIGKQQTNSILCSKNSIRNYLSITNNDDVHSCETQRKTIIEFQTLQLKIVIYNVLLPHQWVC